MRNHGIDGAIRALAADQYDCFSYAQVIACGGTQQLIKRRLRSGEWVRRTRGVYGFGNRHPSWRMHLWIAHLQAGLDTVVSHAAAAGLYGLLGFPEGPFELTVPHPSNRSVPGATVHETRDLPASHIWERAGLPVTSLPRTFVDLAATTRRSRLFAALEEAVITKKVSISKVGACLLYLNKPGRRGVFKLGDVIDELRPGEPVLGSVMEARFLHLLERAGEPLPIRQYPHPGRLPAPGTVDFAYPSACLICEVDGRRWHTRRQDIQRDHARDMAAKRAGYDTIRILYEDLHDWPEDTLDTVRTIRLQREAVLAALGR
jgi:hypothetical protein